MYMYVCTCRNIWRKHNTKTKQIFFFFFFCRQTTFFPPSPSCGKTMNIYFILLFTSVSASYSRYLCPVTCTGPRCKENAEGQADSVIDVDCELNTCSQDPDIQSVCTQFNRSYGVSFCGQNITGNDGIIRFEIVNTTMSPYSVGPYKSCDCISNNYQWSGDYSCGFIYTDTLITRYQLNSTMLDFLQQQCPPGTIALKRRKFQSGFTDTGIFDEWYEQSMSLDRCTNDSIAIYRESPECTPTCTTTGVGPCEAGMSGAPFTVSHPVDCQETCGIASCTNNTYDFRPCPAVYGDFPVDPDRSDVSCQCFVYIGPQEFGNDYRTWFTNESLLDGYRLPCAFISEVLPVPQLSPGQQAYLAGCNGTATGFLQEYIVHQGQKLIKSKIGGNHIGEQDLCVYGQCNPDCSGQCIDGQKVTYTVYNQSCNTCGTENSVGCTEDHIMEVICSSDNQILRPARFASKGRKICSCERRGYSWTATGNSQQQQQLVTCEIRYQQSQLAVCGPYGGMVVVPQFFKTQELVRYWDNWDPDPSNSLSSCVAGTGNCSIFLPLDNSPLSFDCNCSFLADRHIGGGVFTTEVPGCGASNNNGGLVDIFLTGADCSSTYQIATYCMCSDANIISPLTTTHNFSSPTCNWLVRNLESSSFTPGSVTTEYCSMFSNASHGMCLQPEKFSCGAGTQETIGICPFARHDQPRLLQDLECSIKCLCASDDHRMQDKPCDSVERDCSAAEALTFCGQELAMCNQVAGCSTCRVVANIVDNTQIQFVNGTCAIHPEYSYTQPCQNTNLQAVCGSRAVACESKCIGYDCENICICRDNQLFREWDGIESSPARCVDFPSDPTPIPNPTTTCGSLAIAARAQQYIIPVAALFTSTTVDRTKNFVENYTSSSPSSYRALYPQVPFFQLYLEYGVQPEFDGILLRSMFAYPEVEFNFIYCTCVDSFVGWDQYELEIDPTDTNPVNCDTRHLAERPNFPITGPGACPGLPACGGRGKCSLEGQNLLDPPISQDCSTRQSTDPTQTIYRSHTIGPFKQLPDNQIIEPLQQTGVPPWKPDQFLENVAEGWPVVPRVAITFQYASTFFYQDTWQVTPGAAGKIGIQFQCDTFSYTLGLYSWMVYVEGCGSCLGMVYSDFTPGFMVTHCNSVSIEHRPPNAAAASLAIIQIQSQLPTTIRYNLNHFYCKAQDANAPFVCDVGPLIMQTVNNLDQTGTPVTGCGECPPELLNKNDPGCNRHIHKCYSVVLQSEACISNGCVVPCAPDCIGTKWGYDQSIFQGIPTGACTCFRSTEHPTVLECSCSNIDQFATSVLPFSVCRYTVNQHIPTAEFAQRGVADFVDTYGHNAELFCLDEEGDMIPPPTGTTDDFVKRCVPTFLPDGSAPNLLVSEQDTNNVFPPDFNDPEFAFASNISVFDQWLHWEGRWGPGDMSVHFADFNYYVVSRGYTVDGLRQAGDPHGTYRSRGSTVLLDCLPAAQHWRASGGQFQGKCEVNPGILPAEPVSISDVILADSIQPSGHIYNSPVVGPFTTIPETSAPINPPLAPGILPDYISDIVQWDPNVALPRTDIPLSFATTFFDSTSWFYASGVAGNAGIQFQCDSFVYTLGFQRWMVYVGDCGPCTGMVREDFNPAFMATCGSTSIELNPNFIEAGIQLNSHLPQTLPFNINHFYCGKYFQDDAKGEIFVCDVGPHIMKTIPGVFLNPANTFVESNCEECPSHFLRYGDPGCNVDNDCNRVEIDSAQIFEHIPAGKCVCSKPAHTTLPSRIIECSCSELQTNFHAFEVCRFVTHDPSLTQLTAPGGIANHTYNYNPIRNMQFPAQVFCLDRKGDMVPIPSFDWDFIDMCIPLTNPNGTEHDTMSSTQNAVNYDQFNDREYVTPNGVSPFEQWFRAQADWTEANSANPPAFYQQLFYDQMLASGHWFDGIKDQKDPHATYKSRGATVLINCTDAAIHYQLTSPTPFPTSQASPNFGSTETTSFEGSLQQPCDCSFGWTGSQCSVLKQDLPPEFSPEFFSKDPTCATPGSSCQMIDPCPEDCAYDLNDAWCVCPGTPWTAVWEDHQWSRVSICHKAEDLQFDTNYTTLHNVDPCGETAECGLDQNCVCNVGFADLPNDPGICSSSTCQTQNTICNGLGTCVGDRICECSNGATGDLCEIAWCDLSPSRCVFGSCQLQNGYSACVCNATFYGERCELSAFPRSISNPNVTCNGHGTLSIADGSCACAPNFIGAACEFDVTDPANMCMSSLRGECSGHGKCRLAITDDRPEVHPRCDCQEEYFGTFCESSICPVDANGIVCHGQGVCEFDSLPATCNCNPTQYSNDNKLSWIFQYSDGTTNKVLVGDTCEDDIFSGCIGGCIFQGSGGTRDCVVHAEDICGRGECVTTPGGSGSSQCICSGTDILVQDSNGIFKCVANECLGVECNEGSCGPGGICQCDKPSVWSGTFCNESSCAGNTVPLQVGGPGGMWECGCADNISDPVTDCITMRCPVGDNNQNECNRDTTQFDHLSTLFPYTALRPNVGVTCNGTTGRCTCETGVYTELNPPDGQSCTVAWNLTNTFTLADDFNAPLVTARCNFGWAKVDKCHERQCRNGGILFNPNDIRIEPTVCNCGGTGFSGPRCDVPVQVPTCGLNAYLSQNYVDCICSPPWAFDQSTSDRANCTVNTCGQFGVAGASGCTCTEDLWAGPLCNQHTCLNGGSANYPDLQCTCPAQFVGTRCEDVHPTGSPTLAPTVVPTVAPTRISQTQPPTNPQTQAPTTTNTSQVSAAAKVQQQLFLFHLVVIGIVGLI